MLNLKKSIFLLVCLMAAVVANAWTGSYSEPENMKRIDGKAFYVITSAEELAWFAAQVNDGNNAINAVLAKDIVFGTEENTTCTFGWTPIAKDSSYLFEGVLDGAGHTIYGLYVKDQKFAGLVGVGGEKSIVKNLTMASGKIISEVNDGNASVYAGGLVAYGYGLIEGCVNKNEVKISITTGLAYTGGVSGINYGRISNCENMGTIVGSISFNGFSSEDYYYSRTTKTGGVAGESRGAVLDCVNRGNVTGVSSMVEANRERSSDVLAYTGGLVGNSLGSILGCKNLGSVRGSAYAKAYVKPAWAISATGGIAGDGFSVSNSVNEGPVASESSADGPKPEKHSFVGGIVGSSGSVLNCVNVGSVSGFSAGGIAGEVNYGTIKNSFSIAVSLSGTIRGGVVGDYRAGEVISSFYDSDSLTGVAAIGSGSATSVFSMTTANMQKDQFAWILNTTNGTEVNSGVWTRGTSGYPTFANVDSLPIYKVIFNDDGIFANRYTNYRGYVTFPEISEPADGNIFSGWFNSNDVKVKESTVFSADQTINAVYTDASNVFWTINFYNADSSLISSSQVQHGSIVSYTGETPVLKASAEFSYEFDGWNVDPTNATENFDYYATYRSTIRSYTVSFIDFDGDTLQSISLPYGKIPSYASTPSRSASVEWSYTFAGWTPDIETVSRETSYKAVYDSTKVMYKVIFMNGTVVYDSVFVAYGAAATAPSENPIRDGYKFVGWNPSFTKIAGDLTVKAMFEELVIRTVFIQYIDDGSTDVEEKLVEDNSEYTLPPAADKNGHTFLGWYDAEGNKLGDAGDKITIVDDITITAKYEINKYTITFMFGSTKLQSSQVEYNKMPTYDGVEPSREKTAAYTYEFAGWSPVVSAATKDETYTAVFDSTLNKFTIVFNSAGGTLQTKSVAYGSVPSYTGEEPAKDPTAQYEYSFAGWDPEITSVTAAKTYTAIFDSTLRAYKVTFKVGNETVQSKSVFYGSTPVYTGDEPAKTKSENYTYEFAGWTPEIKSVTGAQTYTAVFDSTKIAKPASSSSVPSSSSSSEKGGSSSSSNKGSSSSGDKDALTIVKAAPQFSVEVQDRTLQIAGAKSGAVYSLMDMQGRLLKQGTADANFSIEVPRAGTYLIRINKSISRVTVR